jgi:hypothetical protein
MSRYDASAVGNGGGMSGLLGLTVPPSLLATADEVIGPARDRTLDAVIFPCQHLGPFNASGIGSIKHRLGLAIGPRNAERAVTMVRVRTHSPASRRSGA